MGVLVGTARSIGLVTLAVGESCTEAFTRRESRCRPLSEDVCTGMFRGGSGAPSVPLDFSKFDPRLFGFPARTKFLMCFRTGIFTGHYGMLVAVLAKEKFCVYGRAAGVVCYLRVRAGRVVCHGMPYERQRA